MIPNNPCMRCNIILYIIYNCTYTYSTLNLTASENHILGMQIWARIGACFAGWDDL